MNLFISCKHHIWFGQFVHRRTGIPSRRSSRGYSSLPSRETGGSRLIPNLSGDLLIREGLLDPDPKCGSGLRHVSGGVVAKNCGIISTTQENSTLLTLPGRSLIWVGKAGLCCAATARGPPVCFLRSVGCGPGMA